MWIILSEKHFKLCTNLILFFLLLITIRVGLSGKCPHLVAPRHGMLKYRGRGRVGEGPVALGQIVIYSCKPGYILVPGRNRKVKCTRKGTWSNSPPTCRRISITCPRLAPPDNGRIWYTDTGVKNKIVFGTRARFSCNPGSILEPRIRTSVRCTKHGNWLPQPPICIDISVTCPNLTPPRNGLLRYTYTGKGNTIVYGTRVVFKCNPGFRIVPQNRRKAKCTSMSRWSRLPPKCIQVNVGCSRIQAPENGNIQYVNTGKSKGILYGTMAVFTCNPGFDLCPASKQQLRCTRKGQWSSPPPKCTKISATCLRLTSPKHGTVRYADTDASKNIVYGTRAIFDCKDGYSLFPETSRNIKCTKGSLWSAAVPECLDYAKCGLGGIQRAGRIFGGKKARDAQWPWQVAIFQSSDFLGSGAIISNRFILTAAHLFNKGRASFSYRVLAGEILLLNDPLGIFIRDKYALRIEKIFVHEKYTKGNNYMHDIALLKLKSKITWSYGKRPVCLPTADSRLSENTSGFVAGWGRNMDKSMSNELQYQRLTVQTNEACAKGARDSLYSHEKMFCARSGQHGAAVCKGDSGGPFVVADDKDKTQFSWNVVGIVSWGFNEKCGEKGYYSYYTRVAPHIDWIKKIIAANS